MKLRIGLKNFKGAFARVWLNMETSDLLSSFASVEMHMDKNYSLTLSQWKRLSLCHRWSREQPQPGSFSQRQREVVEREPGNEVALRLAIPTSPRR